MSWPRFGRPAAFVAGLAALFSANLASPQAPPAFPAGVDLVRIDVVVLGKDGQPVTGLTAADFEITEGGKPHEIASFEPVVVRSAPKPAAAEAEEPPRVSSSIAPVPQQNRYFLIFIDDVHISPLGVQRVRTQLGKFLDQETREGDWLTVVAPMAGLRWTARTAFERRQISTLLESIRGQFRKHKEEPSDFAAMRTEEYASAAEAPSFGPGSSFSVSPSLMAAEIYARAKRRAHGTLSSLSDALSSLAGFKGRKSLLFYSEGFMKSPSLPDYDRVIELARRLGVSVLVQDPRGLGTGAPSPDGTDDGGPTLMLLDTEAGGLSYVATSTGGQVSMSNDLMAPLREAAVEASAYYLIGFQPSAGPPGERTVKVRVRGDGLKVRAPEHYFVGDPAPVAKPVPPAVRALGQVADATDIPLRVATLFLDASTEGQPTTTVAVEIPPIPTESGDRQLTLLVEVRSIDKGDPIRDTADITLPPGDKPTVATRELHLHPGVWQARVVIRDPRTEKLGSVLHTFAVPEGAGLRVSSPVLGNKLERPANPRVQLRLDRRFLQTDSLYCQYHVFGAAPDPATHRPRVTGSFAVLREGQPPQEGPASPIDAASDGDFQRLVGFKLSNFAPGEYTLVLRVTDQVSGQSREMREPFSVGDGF